VIFEAPPKDPRFSTGRTSSRSCERSYADCFTLHRRRCTHTMRPISRRGHSDSFRGVHVGPSVTAGSDRFGPPAPRRTCLTAVLVPQICVQHVDVPTDARTCPSVRIRARLQLDSRAKVTVSPMLTPQCRPLHDMCAGHTHVPVHLDALHNPGGPIGTLLAAFGVRRGSPKHVPP
jgi:hypothetical protein